MRILTDIANLNWGSADGAPKRLARGVATMASLLGSLTLTGTALGATCVHMDDERDNLPESDRAATKTLFEQALIDNKQEVVQEGPTCTDVWRVYSLKLGSSVTLTVNSPNDRRTMRVRSLDDIAAAYSQIVKSLLSGVPLSDESNIDRTNVTQTQMSNNRVAADSLWYLRLGYGGVIASTFDTGPAFGFGWRKELDKIAIDLSFANLVLTKKESGSYSGVAGSIVKLEVLYYFDSLANNSFYAGGGLAYGFSDFDANGYFYTGSGIHGELTAGYEMFRASNIRILFQLDASLPTYSSTIDEFFSVTTAGGTVTNPPSHSIYAPSMVLSLGLGWGRANTILVRQID